MKPISSSTTMDTLLTVWRHVLQQPSIRPDDNFFDLGGDPALASNLFAEISDACGRELSPLFIYQAPTISELAALLDQPSPPRLPPAVLLRTGAGPHAVFIAPGLGGDIRQLFGVMNYFHSPQSVYGLHFRGMDGVTEPFDQVEDMADFYIDAVKKLQARGPYYFIGYSFGGLVMLEMAQKLSKAGDEIRMLVLVDTYPHLLRLSTGQSVRLAWRRAGSRMRGTKKRILVRAQLVRSKPPSQLFLAAARRLRSREDHGANEAGREVPGQEGRGHAAISALERVKESGFVAWRHYRPSYYAGTILFVKAEAVTWYPRDPAAVWGRIAAKLEMETSPGTHTSMLSNHPAIVAGILSRYLAERLPAKSCTAG